MKKIVLFTLSFFVFSLLYLNYEVEASFLLNEDLHEGEEVVDFSIIKEIDVEDGIRSTPTNWRNLLDDAEEAYTINRPTPKWEAVSKEYRGYTYCGWKNAGVSTQSGGVLRDTFVRKRSNTYSGDLKVKVKVLTALVKFNIEDSYERASSYSSKNLPDGNYRLQFREVYHTYKVKQEKKWGSRVLETRYVYPKKWTEHQYRVVKF